MINANELRRREFEMFSGKFCSESGLIHYDSAESAEEAYLTLQEEEMRRYFGIICTEPGMEILENEIAYMWVRRFAAKFHELWNHIHLFIKPENEPQEAQGGDLWACVCGDDREGNDFY